MSKISNYEELVAERRRTEMFIADRKQAIHDRVDVLKDKVAPLLNIIPFFNLFKKKEPNNFLLKTGAGLVIDFLVGHKLLRKAGILTRLLVPALLKTVSSGVIGKFKSNGQGEK